MRRPAELIPAGTATSDTCLYHSFLPSRRSHFYASACGKKEQTAALEHNSPRIGPSSLRYWRIKSTTLPDYVMFLHMKLLSWKTILHTECYEPKTTHEFVDSVRSRSRPPDGTYWPYFIECSALSGLPPTCGQWRGSRWR